MRRTEVAPNLTRTGTQHDAANASGIGLSASSDGGSIA